MFDVFNFVSFGIMNRLTEQNGRLACSAYFFYYIALPACSGLATAICSPSRSIFDKLTWSFASNNFRFGISQFTTTKLFSPHRWIAIPVPVARKDAEAVPAVRGAQTRFAEIGQQSDWRRYSGPEAFGVFGASTWVECRIGREMWETWC
jgi:hypothetical protein